VKAPFEVFVPGRVCLFGEHPDWAGGHRRTNSQVEKGYAIIAGTSQGLFASVKANSSLFVFRAVLSDGRTESIRIPMEAGALLATAQEGGFFSYVAGVAFQILTHYHVEGTEIDHHALALWADGPGVRLWREAHTDVH